MDLATLVARLRRKREIRDAEAEADQIMLWRRLIELGLDPDDPRPRPPTF